MQLARKAVAAREATREWTSPNSNELRGVCAKHKQLALNDDESLALF
jgi:hypothetical protein